MFSWRLAALTLSLALTLTSTAAAQLFPQSDMGETGIGWQPGAVPEPAVGVDAGTFGGIPGDQFLTVTTDAMYLHRSTLSGQQRLLVDPNTNSDVFSSANLPMADALGPRLGLIFHDVAGAELEFDYFGIDGWKVNREVTAVGMPSGTANLILDDQIIVPVTDAQFTYQSRFYNAEANLRLSYCDWFRPLIGFRWVELNDRYQVTVPAAAGGSFTEAVRANNHLYGLQIGADARIFDQGRFRLEAIAKTGIFCDDENQQTDVWAPASPTASAGASCNHIAYLSEVGLMFSVAVTDHLRLRAGYQAIFLESVALAPMQLPATDLGGGTARVDMSGNLLYHGATAGLELTW
jgi:hypothetical protein